ncbi:response regulator [Fulvivirgaceae bacterium BMA10]|uniref:Response regulator n=1 Tax=Splendidivirga corallicola TaxID=3051826 RepID=A0ABT8KSL4_9BACT|nr:response regulator [Fulvivirgaceae bacterium BMA10]
MNKLRILIVEDDILTAERIAEQLTSMGHRITGKVVSGEDAISAVDNDLPDLILLDIKLRGVLDGIQTAEIIKQKADIPIIYLTAYSDKSTIERASRTHPAYFLPKPYTIKNLSVAIEFVFMGMKTGSDLLFPVYLMNDRIFIKNQDVFEKLMISDILWVQASRSWVEIFTTDERKYTLSMNLSKFSAQVTCTPLIRVNQSYIVNIDHIEAFQGNILIIQGERISISKVYAKDFMEHFKIIKTVQ